MKTITPMSHRDFNKAVKEHLSSYKHHRLQVHEDGEWAATGRHYGHILPRNQAGLNIIGSYRDNFWRDFEAGTIGGRIKLHSDFHHLNSSQALAFNLLYPLIREDQLYLSALNIFPIIPKKDVHAACFELILDPLEKTNFDFGMRYDDGSVATFEIKYSESGFAGRKHGEVYEKRWLRLYKDRVADVFSRESATKEIFLENYQLFRNLIYLGAHPENVVVFIHPAANGAFRNLKETLDRVLSDKCRERAAIIELERLSELLVVLSRNVNDDVLVKHYLEFKEKYLAYLQ